MIRLRPTVSLMPILLPKDIALRHRREHLPPPKRNNITRRDHGTPQILLDQLTGRLAEDDVDLLERLVLRLGHEEDLVEPAEDGDAAVEAEGEADLGHGFLHLREEVGDEEGAEEEGRVGRFHPV